MTNSTPLSPAAQACVTAFQKVDFESGHFTCEDMWIISREVAAAALRAAADQCKIEWNYHPDYPETESVIVVSDLLSIAAELENHAN